ncbi:very short patch repair endonuclease [Alistipes indistinctus]|uniref:very short patch repair endonuclease n=1 Tax=Alistipes indistinctus TaxID=626932 RepID=UPI0036F3E3B8
MTDIFSKEQRSDIMRKVKSKHNKSTELKLIVFFKKNQIRGWRRNYKLYGKPDFVFPKQKVAIFLDGCFWHGHDCRNTKPKDNEEYWRNKISRNKCRDTEVTAALIKKKWKVVRIWECQLKDSVFIHNTLEEVGVFGK